jgi:hypothetical protein
MPAAIRLFDSRACVLKTEAVYGTDSLPTGAANSLQVIEGSLDVEADEIERNIDRTYLGARPVTLVRMRATFRGQIELVGAAAPGSGTPIDAALRACSFGITSVPATSDPFAPVSSSFSSSSLYFEWAGLQFVVLGLRGQLSSVRQEIDGRTVADVSFMGLIDLSTGLTEATIAGITTAAFQRPPVVTKETWALTVDGVAVNAQALTWSQGQDPQLFHGSELREVSYTGRSLSGSLTIFKEAFATINPWSLANDQAPVPLVSTLTGGAGLNLAKSFPAVQFKMPRATSINGAAGIEMPFIALPVSGNDEVSLAFT